MDLIVVSCSKKILKSGVFGVITFSKELLSLCLILLCILFL